MSYCGCFKAHEAEDWTELFSLDDILCDISDCVLLAAVHVIYLHHLIVSQLFRPDSQSLNRLNLNPNPFFQVSIFVSQEEQQALRESSNFSEEAVESGFLKLYNDEDYLLYGVNWKYSKPEYAAIIEVRCDADNGDFFSRE